MTETGDRPPEEPEHDDRIVARLHAVIVDELRRRDHPPDAPITVAELSDQVAPYSAVRSALGLELKADYDHALLRLLAGEGEHARLEPEEVGEELRRVLSMPYPDVSAYREYTAARVWVDPDSPAHAAPARDPAALEAIPDPGSSDDDDRPDTSDASQVWDDADDGEEAAEADGGGVPERAPIRIHREPEDLDAGAEVAPHPGALVPREGRPCSFCSEPLPPGRRVRFCPFCGGDQRLRPCPRCDAVMERDWSYCVRCGLRVDEDD